MLSLNDALFNVLSRHSLKWFMMVAKAFAISIKNTFLEIYTCYTSILFFIKNGTVWFLIPVTDSDTYLVCWYNFQKRWKLTQ